MSYDGDQYYSYDAPPDSAYYGGNNAQVVAQPAGNPGSDVPPRWNGDLATFDLWEDLMKDWTRATKVPIERQAMSVLRVIPEKVKKRVRQEGNADRLVAKEWRGAVSAQDHYTLLEVIYQAAEAVYREAGPQRVEVHAYCLKLVRKELGLTKTDEDPPEAIIQLKVKSVLGAEWKPRPIKPVKDQIMAVAEGNHSIHGRLPGEDKKYVGEKLTCGVDYLLEFMRDTQMAQPIHRYLYRLRRFLSIRKGRGGDIVKM